MKWMSKLTAAALCGALLLAGCSGDTSWAYELGGERMPAGVYIVGMIDAYGTPWAAAVNEGMEDITPKKVLATQVDGQAADAYIQEEAQRRVLMYYGARAKAAELGVELDEEQVASAKSTAAAIWSGQAAQYLSQYAMYGIAITGNQYMMYITGEDYERNGVAQSSLEDYYVSQTLKDRLFEAIYGEGGTEAVSDETLFERFKADYARAAVMYISKSVNMQEEPSEEIDAKNAEIKILAESYLERLKNGESVEELQYEYDQSEAQEGEEVTKYDAASMTTIINTSGEDASLLGIALRTAVPNEPLLIEDEYMIYIANPLELRLEDMADYRNGILYEMKQDEFETMLETAGAAASPTANQSALNRYTPKKLDF